MLLGRSIKHWGCTEPFHRSLRFISLGVQAFRFTVAHPVLLGQAQNRLKEVVIEPQAVIQRIKHALMGKGIKAGIPEQVAHERAVLLLDEAIVVLHIRPTARQGDDLDRIAEVAHHGVIQEFAAIMSQLARFCFPHNRGIMPVR